MTKNSKSTPRPTQPPQKSPVDDHDTRSLSDDATFGDQPLRGPQSLGDESTFGDGLGGPDSELIDDDMEIVDLEARYTIESTLGKGGMGEVLLATDTRLNRKVAIKRILGKSTSNPTAVKRFLKEARSIAAVSHPNIVQIHDYGRDTDGPFLIMEYVSGGTLHDLCKEGPIPMEEAVGLVCQLCDGLSKAHAANIVHRDIKPANVLVTVDGFPKLTDFGLAKFETVGMERSMTMDGAVLGTLDFMPPEQRRDASLVDHRSDLWSLAATLYQMVTGESPRIIRVNKLPSQLRDLLDQALETSPDERFQQAIDFGAALKASLTEASVDVAANMDLGAGNVLSATHGMNPTGNSVGSVRLHYVFPAWDVKPKFRFGTMCAENVARNNLS